MKKKHRLVALGHTSDLNDTREYTFLQWPVNRVMTKKGGCTAPVRHGPCCRLIPGPRGGRTLGLFFRERPGKAGWCCLKHGERRPPRGSEPRGTPERAENLRRLRECLDMPLQFFWARPSREEEADHLESPLGRLEAGVEHDQQTGDDAAIDLDLDAVRLGGQEMAAAEELLEHPKEVLDQPPQTIQFTDEFGGKIEPIRSDPQKAIAVRPGAAAASLATAAMRRRLHGYDPDWMIGNDPGLRPRVERHDFIADHAGGGVGIGELKRLHDSVRGVVPDTTAIAAVLGDDRIPQSEMRVATGHDVHAV